MSIRESARGLTKTHGEIAEELAKATVGTRVHELLSQLHHHLGEVVRVSEELATLQESQDKR